MAHYQGDKILGKLGCLIKKISLNLNSLVIDDDHSFVSWASAIDLVHEEVSFNVFVTIEAPKIESYILFYIRSFDDLKDSVFREPVVHGRIGAIENDVHHWIHLAALSLPERETNLQD